MSFSLKKGERLAIVGKNGAGKSTLAKALCGFVPSQGKLIYKGRDISQDSIAERSEPSTSVSSIPRKRKPRATSSKIIVWLII